MKALLVAIQSKWLKMILDGEKKFEFRNWKVPVGTTIYFYESKGKKRSIDVWEQYPYYYCYRDDGGQGMLLDYIREGRGKVVAKAIVKDVYEPSERVCFDIGADMNDRSSMKTPLINIKDRMNPYIAKYEYINKMEKIGYDYDNTVNYAIELSQVEEIEPKDVTEFVSWNKYKSYEKALCEEYMTDEYDTFIINSMETMVDYEKAFRLAKPPQSRTWIYVGENY